MAKKRAGMGLLPKLLIGFLVPVLLGFFALGSIYFFSWSIGPVEVTSIRDMGTNTLTELKTFFLLESRISMGRLVERSIQDKALGVAKQLEIFIKANPRKKIEDLLKDPQLQAIAVQEVGENDYTAVYDKQGVNYFHVTPEFVGQNIRDLFQQNPEMLKIMEGGLKDATSGYYDWTDKDGKSIPKFIYVKPIPDTDLVVVADASVEELSRPSSTIESRVTRIESRYLSEYEKNFKIFFLIILGTFLVIVIVFFLFSRSLVYPIHHLSEVADRISMGDLDTPIDVKAKGEVGVLAESIERMQASVRAAIKRLQRSRGETGPGPGTGTGTGTEI